MTEEWDEVADRNVPPLKLSFSPNPLHMFVGFGMGLVLAVLHPGLIVLVPLIWLIPAAIALPLWFIRPARSLATGFAAASVAWLSFYVSFLAFMAFASG